MTTPSTFRVDFRAGVYSVLFTYQAANPTLLNNVHDYPPESFQTPCGYVEKPIPEQMVLMNGVWQRVLEATVVLLSKLISNSQATHEQDVLIDGLVSAYSVDFHATSGRSETVPLSVADTETPGSEGVRYSAAIITVRGSIQEGRL